MAKEAIDVLNGLIHTSEDGHKGFNEAADVATDPQLKIFFRENAEDCERAVRELRAQVRELGGDPTSGGSVAGAAHRGWVKVKSVVEDPNRAVLEECERGQDVAKAAYTKALKAELPPAARALVERQAQGALRNHDRVRALRDEWKATQSAH